MQHVNKMQTAFRIPFVVMEDQGNATYVVHYLRHVHKVEVMKIVIKIIRKHIELVTMIHNVKVIIVFDM